LKTPVFANQFKKDYKLSEKRGKDLRLLKLIITELVNENSLPASNKDHNLTRNYKNCRECHIMSDWLLIYEIIEDEIQFLRTGTHSDLF